MYKNKLNFFHYLLFVYCFFPFSFKPMRIFQLLLAYGGSFIYVLLNLNFLLSKIKSKFAYNSMQLFIFMVVFLLIRPLATMDFSYLVHFLGYVRSVFLVLCVVIICLKHEVESFEDISRIYINIMCFYVGISLVLMIPFFRILWTSVIYQTEINAEAAESVVYYTRFGLQGFSGWGHTILCSIGVSLFWVLKLNKSKISYFRFVLLLIGCACYGRSGLLVSLGCTLIACIYSVKQRKLRYIFFILFIVLFFLILLFVYMEYFSKEYNAFSWMLEPFVNKIKGNSASSSSNELKYMYERLDIANAKSLLLGDGYYTAPSGKGYYQQVDIGWARPLLFGGLVFELAYYFSLLFLLMSAVQSAPKKIRSIFVTLVFISILILELKGETYFMVSRVLLLFCFVKEEKDELLICDKPVYDRWSRKSIFKYCFKYNG